MRRRTETYYGVIAGAGSTGRPGYYAVMGWSAGGVGDRQAMAHGLGPWGARREAGREVSQAGWSAAETMPHS